MIEMIWVAIAIGLALSIPGWIWVAQDIYDCYFNQLN